MRIDLQPQQWFLSGLVDKSPASWIGYGGSRGGGKSGGIRRIMLKRRVEHPKTSGLIIRRVFDDVQKNHINKMWEEFPDLHEYYKSGEKVIELPPSLGSGRIFFDGAENAIDVKRKSFGPEFYDVMVDQAEQFTEEELVQLKTICRWPGVPENSCKFILPFNPGGVGAAFLQRIFYLKEYHEREIPQDYVFLQAYGWENVEWSRAALAADGYAGDCLGQHCGKCGPCVYYAWTDKQRFDYYITRSQYGQEQNRLPAHMRAGQLLGDFKTFAGQYFSNFDESVHVWDLQDIEFQPQWPVWGSLDWGYIHSASFHWHTQAGAVFENEEGKTVRKRLVVTFRELIKDHLSERALAEEICAANNGLRLSNIYAGHDLWKKESSDESKEQAMSRVFRSHGLPSLKQAKIDRIDGWRHMHRSLDEGEWIITRNCKEAVRAVPTAINDSMHPGREEDVLKTNTMYDDVLDELRYGLYSQYSPADVSDDVKIARQASHLTDPTNRNILIMRLNHEKKLRGRDMGSWSGRSSGRLRRYVS